MKKILALTILVYAFNFLNFTASAQSWNITGNSGTTAGTNFIGTTDAKDFVFKTNNLERGRIKSNGNWQFGTSGVNIAKFDTGGNLSFAGSAAYKVAGNKYAFQYSGNPNYGLFFNAQSLLYEFRTSTAAPIFSVGANTGNGIFTGNLKVGAYTLPATDGTSGQVLKTNGAGVLTWSADNGGTSQWTTSGSAIYYNTGNVGIGTISPSVKLHVVSTSGNVMNIDGGTGMYVGLYEAGTYKGYFGSYSGAADDIDFGTGGSNASGKLNLVIQATPKMTIDASGNVGIGTTSPVPKFSVVQNSTSIATASFVNTGMGPNISWINFGSTGDWYIRSSSNSGKVILQDQSTSTGPVCIGTTQWANGYKLCVDGKIICEEVKVQNNASWPDYVFTPSYKLPDLLSVEKQIQVDGHLPGVPSADEVCDNGISLGEMQATLLQKIEELTLYMIEQQKQINELKKENEELKTSLLK